MRRYLVPVLLAIAVLASGPAVGCARDKPQLSEQEVVQTVYDYVMDKAGSLQGCAGRAEQKLFSWAVDSAAMSTWIKLTGGPGSWGEPVDIGGRVYQDYCLNLKDIRPISTWTGVLKKLAGYDGHGLWSVSIGHWEWRVDEETGGGNSPE